MDTLTIKKDRVLAAAAACATAKETLKTLFPEVFGDEKYFNFSGMEFRQSGLPEHFRGIGVRVGGKYDRKGFYLSGDHDWQILKDEYNHLVLIPTKK